uniref:GTPase, putative (NOG1) n=1 Tax=uncultured marine group II/III euryarchaeote KM3_110_E06 TaxID=1457852 RepID=A0A075G7I1_9EURY|nr:GTPase, putative (NOG1) [uncultured marine group II/III euryarchaeote KM3_110_E06]
MASVEWRKIPTVLYPQEVLDKAFRRASKQSLLVEDPDKYHRVRKQMARMVQAASDTIAETLLKWIDKWPSLNAQSSFDQALVDAAVGADEFRQNLGAIQWAAERVRQISGESQSKMMKFRSIEPFHAERRHAYGRMSSIIEQIGDNILWLGQARDILRQLPSIDAAEPCIVVAGAPNVGKSALITELSSGEPEVAAYPFTTKRLHVGHFEHRRRTYQMVDTPGLLDRPMDDRNQIEMQAIAALENVGDIVLFLIDPSEKSGISREDQEHLLGEVRELLAERPLLLVHSKSDLHEVIEGDEEVIRISSQTGQGIDEIRSLLIESIAADEVIDPLALPEMWHRQVEEIEPVGSPEEILARREEAIRNSPRPKRGRRDKR